MRTAALALPALLAALSACATARPASSATAPCDGTGQGPLRWLDLRDASAGLTLLGARHWTDPADPVWSELERRFEAAGPTVVLVEGEERPAPAARDEAIRRGGEAGFLCWLAARRSVPCRSLDLTEAEWDQRLLRTHAPEEVLLFHVVMVLAYFNPRPPEQRPPGDLVAWTIGRYGPNVGLAGATPADVAASAERLLGRPWRPGEVTTVWHDPGKTELLTQRLSREGNELREPAMLEKLLAAATPGARVFAAVGEGHACNLEGALRARWSGRRPPP